MDCRTSPVRLLSWKSIKPVSTSHNDPLLWLPAAKMMTARPSSPSGVYNFLGVLLDCTWGFSHSVLNSFLCRHRLHFPSLVPKSKTHSNALESGEAEAARASYDSRGCSQLPHPPSCFSWRDASFKPESLFSQEIETSHVTPGLFKIAQSTLITHTWVSEVIKEKSCRFWAPQLSEHSKDQIVMCFFAVSCAKRPFHLLLFLSWSEKMGGAFP